MILNNPAIQNSNARGVCNWRWNTWQILEVQLKRPDIEPPSWWKVYHPDIAVSVMGAASREA